MTALVQIETVVFSPDSREDSGSATVTFRVQSGYVRDQSFAVAVTVALNGVGDEGVVRRGKLAFHRLSRRLAEHTQGWDDPAVGESGDADLAFVDGLQLGTAFR